jgi:hypothetical protein
LLRNNKIPKDSAKFSNGSDTNGKAHIMTTHRGKSHNKLGKRVSSLQKTFKANVLK